MSQIRDNTLIKVAVFHPKARDAIRSYPDEIKRELGKAIFDLQKGAQLTMPLSRPMPSIAAGVSELRMHDRFGHYRVVYYARLVDKVLVLHAFMKKTMTTHKREIEIAQKRLKEMRSE